MIVNFVSMLDVTKDYRYKYYNLKYKIMKIGTKKKHRVRNLLIVLSSILLVVIGILAIINFQVIPKKKAEEAKKEYNLALQLLEEERYDEAKVLFMDNIEYGYSDVYLKYIDAYKVCSKKDYLEAIKLTKIYRGTYEVSYYS